MLHSVRWIPRLSWVGHSQPITALAISFDGNVAATGSSDGSIRTWHTKLGMCSTIITDFLQDGPEDYRRVLAVTLSEDGSMLSGSFSETEGTITPWAPDYVALVWNLNVRSGCNSSSPPKAALIGHEDVVTSACFHPVHKDGRQLLTASRDSTIKLWDVPSRRCLYSFRTHTPVAQVAFTSNAEFISYRDVGGTVKVFTYGLTPKEEESPRFLGGVSQLQLALNGELLAATGLLGREIKVWETHTCRCLHTLVGPADVDYPEEDSLHIRVMSFSTENRFLAAGTMRGWIGVWDLSDTSRMDGGPLAPTFSCQTPNYLEILALTISPNNLTLASLARDLDSRPHKIYL